MSQLIRINQHASGRPRSLTQRLRRAFVAIALITTALTLPLSAHCAPETWFDPTISITGAASSARFGASLACSHPSAATDNISFIAVGAPLENGGQGAVYVYNPDSPNSYLQKIISDDPDVNKAFGSSVAFIEDLNLDGIDELAISEPNDSGLAGVVRIYLSTNSSPPYSLCGSKSSAASWGYRLLEIDRDGSTTTSKLVVTSQSTDLLTIEEIQKPFFSGCEFTEVGNFNGTSGERFGFSVAEIKKPEFDANSKILIGAPNASSGAGIAYTVNRDLVLGSQLQSLRSGSSTNSLGMCVAADRLNDIFAFSSPGAQTVDVSSLVKNSDPEPNICSLSLPVVGDGLNIGTSMIHLNTAFSAFLGASGASFATSITDSDTGGAIALFAANATNGCSSVRMYNNCAADTTQAQGSAITGGTQCKFTYLGSKTPMLIVGSPGWSGSKGRVDIIAQGSELPDVKSCFPTATPTPTPSPTYTPTPLPTHTPSPGSNGNPIVIAPNRGGLPPAEVSTTDKLAVVRVTLPSVTVNSAQARLLARLFKLNIPQVVRMIANNRFTYTYVLRFAEKDYSSADLEDSPAQFTVLAPSPITERTQNSSRVRIVRRRDRISQHRLTPGKVYGLSYSVEIGVKGTKDTKSTRASASVTFST